MFQKLLFFSQGGLPVVDLAMRTGKENNHMSMMLLIISLEDAVLF